MAKTTTYYYNSEQYANLTLVADAVTALKQRLDNNPTDWVVVKQATSNGEGGWIISPTPLTDEEINTLDASLYYNVSAQHDGTTHVGCSGIEAAAKVLEIRASYARWLGANTITKVVTEELTPTNEDMSGYV